ncbi:hypothetical protein [Halosimplex halobium]|uniref:hypothetical protein n=1 Tax=Halosimplex halobium TaxID=3396618 RepID=UPI003F572A62
MNDSASVRRSAALRFPAGFVERTRALDLLALLAVPVVLVAAFALPEPVRRSLAFEYTDPSAVAAFASAYVHVGPAHLLTNVGGYLLVVPTAYLLSVASGHRRRFFLVFATVLVAFPPVLSYLNLAAVRTASGLGFSGVLLAFVGYLAYAVAEHLAVNLRVGPAASVAPALFFLGFAVAAPLSVQSVTVDRATVALGTAGLVLATLLSALLFALSAADETDSLRRRLRFATARRGSFELAVLSLALFVAVQFVAFPPRPTAGPGTVNLYTHLLGYALGFMVTYVSVQVFDRLDADRPDIDRPDVDRIDAARSGVERPDTDRLPR